MRQVVEKRAKTKTKHLIFFQILPDAHRIAITQTKWKHSSGKSPRGNYAFFKCTKSNMGDSMWCFRPFKNCNSKFIHLPNPVLSTTFVHNKTIKIDPFRAATFLVSLSTILDWGTELKLAPTQSQKSFSTHCTELPSLEYKRACTHTLTKAAVFIWERWYACTE